MSLFRKKANYTAQTIGTVVGVSAVTVNKMHLPLAEYEVSGIKYQIRIPYNIAVEMEKQSKNSDQFVRANNNFGTNVRLQMTKIQGCEVKVVYDPDNPKKAKVME